MAERFFFHWNFGSEEEESDFVNQMESLKARGGNVSIELYQGHLPQRPVPLSFFEGISSIGAQVSDLLFYKVTFTAEYASAIRMMKCRRVDFDGGTLPADALRLMSNSNDTLLRTTPEVHLTMCIKLDDTDAVKQLCVVLATPKLRKFYLTGDALESEANTQEAIRLLETAYIGRKKSLDGYNLTVNLTDLPRPKVELDEAMETRKERLRMAALVGQRNGLPPEIIGKLPKLLLRL